MDQVFIVALVGFTSFVAHQTMTRIGAVSAGSMQRAVRALFDYVGTCALFFALNVAAGAAIILVVRSLTPQFIALYQLQNLLLLVLSAAQGFVFQVLRRSD